MQWRSKLRKSPTCVRASKAVRNKKMHRPDNEETRAIEESVNVTCIQPSTFEETLMLFDGSGSIALAEKPLDNNS